MNAGMSKMERRRTACEQVENLAQYASGTTRETLQAWVKECRRTRNHDGDSLMQARLTAFAANLPHMMFATPDDRARCALYCGQAIGLLA